MTRRLLRVMLSQRCSQRRISGPNENSCYQSRPLVSAANRTVLLGCPLLVVLDETMMFRGLKLRMSSLGVDSAEPWCDSLTVRTDLNGFVLFTHATTRISLSLDPSVMVSILTNQNQVATGFLGGRSSKYSPVGVAGMIGRDLTGVPDDHAGKTPSKVSTSSKYLTNRQIWL